MKKWILVPSLVSLALAVMYFYNPTKVDSFNPITRIWGLSHYVTPSNSMKPTIEEGDYFIVNSWPYFSSKPKINDIIVHRYGEGEDKTYFVKRLVGLEGDKIAIIHGNVYINDIPLDQSYLDPNLVQKSKMMKPLESTIPKDHYFVLGDYRDRSNDSRFFGFLPKEAVQGKVIYISKTTQ